MKEIEIYVAKAFTAIPNSKRKDELMQEIVQHLEESASEHIKMGKNREDAINKAIVDFGDFSEILTEFKETSERVSRSSLIAFSLVGSMIIIALMVFINFYYAPKIIWCVYPIFGIIWWPLCTFFFVGKPQADERRGK